MRDIMFIWKYIDIPIKDIQKVQAEYKSAIPKNEIFYQTVNIKIKKFMGLRIEKAILIQVRPEKKDSNIYPNGYSTLDIHKDNLIGIGGELAINIPLENCENSITSFWKTDKPQIKKFTTHAMLYYGYPNDTHFEKIDEFKLTQPVIFNTQIPHSVINPTDKWRRAISLRFIEDPWHLTKL
jgi:hypothetical protein